MHDIPLILPQVPPELSSCWDQLNKKKMQKPYSGKDTLHHPSHIQDLQMNMHQDGRYKNNQQKRLMQVEKTHFYGLLFLKRDP